MVPSRPKLGSVLSSSLPPRSARILTRAARRGLDFLIALASWMYQGLTPYALATRSRARGCIGLGIFFLNLLAPSMLHAGFCLPRLRFLLQQVQGVGTHHCYLAAREMPLLQVYADDERLRRAIAELKAAGFDAELDARLVAMASTKPFCLMSSLRARKSESFIGGMILLSGSSCSFAGFPVRSAHRCNALAKPHTLKKCVAIFSTASSATNV